MVIVALTAWGLFPLFGVDPNKGYRLQSEPIGAALLVLTALVGIILVSYIGAVVAAWVALKRYTRAEVELEFCWLMWLPKANALNQRVFQFVFPLENNS